MGWLTWFDTHSALASWVQAAGVILALAATAWIARRDGKARRASEARDRARAAGEANANFNLAAGLLIELRKLINEANRELTGKDPSAYVARKPVERIRYVIETLQQIELRLLPLRGRSAVMHFRRAAHSCEAAVSTAMREMQISLRDANQQQIDEA
jgi:hypothetical protein